MKRSRLSLCRPLVRRRSSERRKVAADGSASSRPDSRRAASATSAAAAAGTLGARSGSVTTPSGAQLTVPMLLFLILFALVLIYVLLRRHGQQQPEPYHDPEPDDPSGDEILRFVDVRAPNLPYFVDRGAFGTAHAAYARRTGSSGYVERLREADAAGSIREIAEYPALIEAGLLKPADATLARFDRRGRVIGADRLYEVHADPEAACRPVNPHVLHSTMRTIENRAIRRVAGSTSPDDFEEPENELAGTPHFVREADGELPHVGQLCLLLSGAGQIIYASPIVHLRAIRAMNEAALQMDVRTGTGQVSAILPRPRHGHLVEAGEIARLTSFVFFPADHHHHWHVVYPETFGSPRLLWLRLGVDRSPLLRYLRKIEKGRLLEAGPALDELKAVVKLLEGYVEDYDRIYADEAQRDAADAFVREMFAPFVASVPIAGGGSLLSPAAGRKLSEENELRRESAGINGHIEAMRALALKNVLRFEDLKRVERLSQVLDQTFSYEELMDAYGKLEDADLTCVPWPSPGSPTARACAGSCSGADDRFRPTPPHTGSHVTLSNALTRDE